MIRRLLSTRDELAPLILRITMGGVVLMHGFQKLLGWFGGHGPGPTMDAFEKWFGLPYAVTFLVIMSDSFGALFLLLGFLTRVTAVSIGFVMIGAMMIVHGRWGFYMNWYSEPRGEGIEFHLLVLGMSIVLMLLGGGKASIDSYLTKRLGRIV